MQHVGSIFNLWGFFSFLNNFIFPCLEVYTVYMLFGKLLDKWLLTLYLVFILIMLLLYFAPIINYVPQTASGSSLAAALLIPNVSTFVPTWPQLRKDNNHLKLVKVSTWSLVTVMLQGLIIVILCILWYEIHPPRWRCCGKALPYMWWCGQ